MISKVNIIETEITHSSKKIILSEQFIFWFAIFEDLLK
jgi:hypothetical protein